MLYVCEQWAWRVSMQMNICLSHMRMPKILPFSECVFYFVFICLEKTTDGKDRMIMYTFSWICYCRTYVDRRMGTLPFFILAIVTGLTVASHEENNTNSFDIRITLARIPKIQTYYVCQQFQVSTSKKEWERAWAGADPGFLERGFVCIKV